MVDTEEADELFPAERMYAELLQELHDSESVSVRESKLGEKLAALDDQQFIFASLADDKNLPLNENIRKQFFRYYEIECAWRSSESDSKLVGDFDLSHIYVCISENHMQESWPGENEQERQLYAELRTFDETPYTGIGRFTTLRATPGATDPEIWHFDMRRGAARMDIGYAEYLDTLLITKGVVGWQDLFCEISLTEPFNAGFRRGIAEMLEKFPEMFPQHDYSDLVSRYEART